MTDVGGTAPLPASEADAIAQVVLAQPGVARLSTGPLGVVGTYLPGHRVPGVRLADTEVEVHVVAHWVPSLPELAERIRSALRPLAGGRAVTVVIDDLEESQPAQAELPAGDSRP